jgi:hypothetical protein
LHEAAPRAVPAVIDGLGRLCNRIVAGDGAAMLTPR